MNDRQEERDHLTYQALLLIYGQQLHTPRARQVFDTVQLQSDKMALAKLLGQEVRNINKYREQEAMYGGEAPVRLLNLIEETELRIKRLKEELES